MANALYDFGRESFLDGYISWTNDNIKCVLIDTALYTVNLATDDFRVDIPIGAEVAVSANLTTKTVAAGVADADDVTFSSVTGATVEAIVIFQDTGIRSSSPVIAYIDTATGLPVTPNGGDITVQWDNGVDRIFKL